MRMPAAPSSSNCTDARTVPVGLTNASPGTATSGGCCRHGEADAASGQTALACSAGPWAAVSAGCGTLRIMCGQRSTQNTRRDGSMLTPARRHGITHDFTRKDGARRCRTALRSPSMAPPMSLDDMYGRANILSSEPDAQRRSCCISCKRLRTFEDPTWARMSDSVSKRKTHGRIASYAPLSSLPSPRPSPNSYLVPHQLHLALHHSPPDEHLHLPTTPRLPLRCLADKAATLSGLPLEAKTEGDSSSSLRKIRRADLLSPER